MPWPLEANPLDTISKCSSKITVTWQEFSRNSLTDRKAGSSQTKGKELRALSMQRRSRLEIGTGDRRGMRINSSQISVAEDSSTITSPYIPGPRREVTTHVRPRAHGPGQARVTPASKGAVGGKRPRQDT